MDSNLINEANECLEGHNLQIRLAVGQEDKLRVSQYGTLHYNDRDDITAVFQLVENDNQIVAQSHIWARFLNDVQRQFGARFMQQTGLEKLDFADDDDD